MTDACIEPKIATQCSQNDCRKRVIELYKAEKELKSAQGKSCPVTGRPGTLLLNFYGKDRKRCEIAGTLFANSAAASAWLNERLVACESAVSKADLCEFIKNVIECTIKPIPKKVLSAQASVNRKYADIAAVDYKMDSDKLVKIYNEYDAMTRPVEADKAASPPKSPRKKRVESMEVDGDGNITANEKQPKKRSSKKRKAEEALAEEPSKIAKPLDADEISHMLLEAFP